MIDDPKAIALAQYAKHIYELETKYTILQSQLRKVRPYADCYKSVCEVLGIDKDILGYISELNRKHDEEITNLRKQTGYRSYN